MQFGEEWDQPKKRDETYDFFQNHGRFSFDEFEKHPVLREFDRRIRPLEVTFEQASRITYDGRDRSDEERGAYIMKNGPKLCRKVMDEFDQILSDHHLRPLSETDRSKIFELQESKRYNYVRFLSTMLVDRLKEDNAKQLKRGSQKKYGSGFRVPGQ